MNSLHACTEMNQICHPKVDYKLACSIVQHTVTQTRGVISDYAESAGLQCELVMGRVRRGGGVGGSGGDGGWHRVVGERLQEIPCNTNGRTDERTNGRTVGRTDRRTDGRTDGRTDRQTDRYTNT